MGIRSNRLNHSVRDARHAGVSTGNVYPYPCGVGQSGCGGIGF